MVPVPDSGGRYKDLYIARRNLLTRGESRAAATTNNSYDPSSNGLLAAPTNFQPS